MNVTHPLKNMEKEKFKLDKRMREFSEIIKIVKIMQFFLNWKLKNTVSEIEKSIDGPNY